MAIKLMDMIETAGDFPVISAPSVGLPNGERLDALFDGDGKVRESHLPDGLGGSDPRLDNLLEARPGELLVGMPVSGFALDEAYGYCAMLSAPASLAAGETYLVSWDDNDYTVTAFNANVETFGDLVAIGNGSAISPEYPESDAPFIIAATGGRTLILAFTDPAESHDIYIYPMVDKVKESYLPESWVKAYVEEYIDEALRGDY